MEVFDFLQIETEVADDRITGTAKGILGELLQPHVDWFFDVLNGLKIIARKDGNLVYNLYNPPQPTKAGMRALYRKIKERLTGKFFPAVGNLAVTHRCQCNCVHCSAEPFVNPSRDELTTDEFKQVIDGTLNLGASLVIFTGGEPLLRPDLCELIQYVDKDKAMPMIFTNGWHLEEKAEDLAAAGLATLKISVDSPDPEEHDRLRALPGVYKRAMAGAEKARRAGILTGLSTYATHEKLESGDLEKLLKVAQDNGFHEVTIFDCIPSGRFLHDTSKILTTDERKRIIELAHKFHDSDHPMGVVTQAEVNSAAGAGCFGAFAQFYMTAYGDINPCDFNPVSFGNVREYPIEYVWDKMTSHPDFNHKHMTCRMQTPSYRKKYIDPLPEQPKLPVAVEEVERLAAEARQAEANV